MVNLLQEKKYFHGAHMVCVELLNDYVQLFKTGIYRRDWLGWAGPGE